MVAFSYLMLLEKSGLITYNLFGVRASILGWHGLWLAQTIAFFPVASMSIEGVLRSISPSVEYAGRNLGADGFKLFQKVTLPLSTPGVAGAALLVSILVLADFGNPIMISGDFSVLATEAWMRVEGWVDVAGAAVVSIILLVPSVIFSCSSDSGKAKVLCHDTEKIVTSSKNRRYGMRAHCSLCFV